MEAAVCFACLLIRNAGCGCENSRKCSQLAHSRTHTHTQNRLILHAIKLHLINCSEFCVAFHYTMFSRILLLLFNAPVSSSFVHFTFTSNEKPQDTRKPNHVK